MPGPYFQVRAPYASDLPIVACPVRASLGVLGRKWALPILRDVAHRERVRFSDILRNNPGLTPRALSLALKQLQRDGLVVRVPVAGPRTEYFYDLTARGQDVVPVLTALINYSIQHLPGEVFADGRPRSLEQMLPRSQQAMLRDLAGYARTARGRRQVVDDRPLRRVPREPGGPRDARVPGGPGAAGAR